LNRLHFVVSTHCFLNSLLLNHQLRACVCLGLSHICVYAGNSKNSARRFREESILFFLVKQISCSPDFISPVPVVRPMTARHPGIVTGMSGPCKALPESPRSECCMLENTLAGAGIASPRSSHPVSLFNRTLAPCKSVSVSNSSESVGIQELREKSIFQIR
jgi:hypothetical protein